MLRIQAGQLRQLRQLRQLLQLRVRRRIQHLQQMGGSCITMSSGNVLSIDCLRRESDSITDSVTVTEYSSAPVFLRLAVTILRAAGSTSWAASRPFHCRSPEGSSSTASLPSTSS